MHRISPRLVLPLVLTVGAGAGSIIGLSARPSPEAAGLSDLSQIKIGESSQQLAIYLKGASGQSERVQLQASAVLEATGLELNLSSSNPNNSLTSPDSKTTLRCADHVLNQSFTSDYSGTKIFLGLPNTEIKELSEICSDGSISAAGADTIMRQLTFVAAEPLVTV